MKIQPLEAEDQRKSEREHEVAQSCPTLRDPMDCSLPGSSAHGIFQARVLEWGAIAFSDLVAQSCPTLCDPMDRSLSGSSAHGIFQARVLEWVAISSSRGSSQPREQMDNFIISALVAYLYSL